MGGWFPIYEGFRDGKPLDWKLLEKIALIPDADWREDDPTFTNGVIAGIFEEFGVGKTKAPKKEELSQERQRGLEAQARFVLQASAQAEMTAGSVAAQLDFAISAYMKAEETNELPDDLKVFADVSTTLKGLKHTVANVVDEGAALAELEKKILELEAEKETLLKRLNCAESRNRVQTFFNHAVESGGKAFGPAALFGSFFFVSNYVDPRMYNALATEFKQFKADWFL